MTADKILDFTGIRYLWRLVGHATSIVFATKVELSEVKASADSAFHWRGSVPTAEDLPAGAAEGDVWNVGGDQDGSDYVWTGSAWNRLDEGAEPISKDVIDEIFAEGAFSHE